MNRTDARDAAFKLIFSYEAQKESAENLLSLYYDQTEDTAGQQDYISGVVTHAIADGVTVDGLITKYSHGWQLNRISRVSLAAMRLCISELLYCDDIPTKVSINECVELAKTYEGPKAGAFVNGILASVVKEIGLNKA